MYLTSTHANEHEDIKDILMLYLKWINYLLSIYNKQIFIVNKENNI